MEQLVKDKAKCSACTACIAVCGKKAITMKTDIEGFLYPSIDSLKCVDCGLCEKICPLINNYEHESNYQQNVFAAKSKNKATQKKSVSGGLFPEIAKYIIDNNGVVYGAYYDKDFKVLHGSAETILDCQKFVGSKYVQSELGTTFLSIKKQLLEGRKVLFTGTPCQVAGLNSYIGKKNQLLYTCDLICHGVPSPQLFKDYIQYIQRDKKLLSINHRWKGNGWLKSTNQLIYEDGVTVENKPDSILWGSLYFSLMCLRPCCHKCKYTNLNREGDITIGDFWGIEKSHPTFFDKDGISLILLNSEKGKEIFDAIYNNLSICVSDQKKCLQHNLKAPTLMSNQRNMFFEDYNRKGFEFVIKKYTRYSLRGKIRLALIKRLKWRFLEKLL